MKCLGEKDDTYWVFGPGNGSEAQEMERKFEEKDDFHLSSRAAQFWVVLIRGPYPSRLAGALLSLTYWLIIRT